MNSTRGKHSWTDGIFVLLFVAAAIYYGWRLFCIPPWYDELYTYQSFIDQGVIYSMIHWPLPNNHVLFSALSALLNKLGSPYLGLRGISYLSALGSLLLLYRILKKSVPAAAAAAGTAIYAAMYNVTIQAAQGRGYALSGFFLLAALNLLYGICVEGRDLGGAIAPSARKGRAEGRGRKSAAVGSSISGEDAAAGGNGSSETGNHAVEGGAGYGRGHKGLWYYIGYAVCLTGGLYTIPSNLYWVVPICIAGGLYLLIGKKYRTLWRLVAASVAAAAATFVLYSVIWLATGSNYLVKDAESIYYGMGHFQVLAQAPFAAFKRGMDAMLADPNIQSVSRTEFNESFYAYVVNVLNQVYPGAAIFLLVLILLSLCVLLAAVCCRAMGKRRRFDGSVSDAACGRGGHDTGVEKARETGADTAFVRVNSLRHGHRLEKPQETGADHVSKTGERDTGQDEIRLFLHIFCIVLIAAAPIFLIVQCVFPYLRVFTYLGSVLAMAFVLAAFELARGLKKGVSRVQNGIRERKPAPGAERTSREENVPEPGCPPGEESAAERDSRLVRDPIGAQGTPNGQGSTSKQRVTRFPNVSKETGYRIVGILAALCFVVFTLFSWGREDYNSGYDTRDNHIYAALSQLDETEVETVLVGDVYAELNLYFHIERCRGKALVTDTEEPDYVLIDKVQTGEDGEGLVWPYTMNTSDLPWDWINERMEVVYEDDQYIAYQVTQ